MTDPITPKFIAAVDLIKRCGARVVRIAHSGEDDGDPIIWHATAVYGTSNGRPVFEVEAARDPEMAVLRLCERTIDGGQCTHCSKATIFEHESLDFDVVVAMFGLDSCVYAWDPELGVFRRGCE